MVTFNEIHTLLKEYRRTSKGKVIGIAMEQWVNRLRYKIFVNPPPLPLLCEISGALHLAQSGLMAGYTDKLQVNFEIFKVGCRSTCRFGTASLQPYQNDFKPVF